MTLVEIKQLVMEIEPMFEYACPECGRGASLPALATDFSEACFRLLAYSMDTLNLPPSSTLNPGFNVIVEPAENVTQPVEVMVKVGPAAIDCVA